MPRRVAELTFTLVPHRPIVTRSRDVSPAIDSVIRLTEVYDFTGPHEICVTLNERVATASDLAEAGTLHDDVLIEESRKIFKAAA